MPLGTYISVAGSREGATPRIVTETDPMPVHVTGVANSVFNRLFHLHSGVSSALSANAASGSTSITVDSATGFVVGDLLQVNSTLSQEPTFSKINVITVNTFTLDRPLDLDHVTGNLIEVIHADLSTTAGTLISPVSHIIEPEAGEIWHIERIILSINHSSAATDDKFGDLTALTNGVVFRAHTNGQIGTFTNWKVNRDIRLDMYDVTYTDKAGSSLFGTHARGSFSKIGVTVRLDGDRGDYMEILVQDNLTTLDSFLINAQGHAGR